MPLQIAERAVVGDDLEAVGERLEAAAGTVATVLPRRRSARAARRPARPAARRRPRGARRPRPSRTTRRAARRATPPPCRACAAGAPTAPTPARRSSSPSRAAAASAASRRSRRNSIQRPPRSSRGTRTTKLGMIFCSSSSSRFAVAARLGERMREQMQHELLVRLAAAVDTDMRQRRRGSKPRTRSSAFARTARVCAPADSSSRAGELTADPGRRLLEQAAVGLEDVVERALVLRTEAGVAVIAVPEAVELVVIGDVARRLLEIRGEPRSLEDLRQQVRRPLARDVRPAELRDRVVAVPEEDPFVQVGRSLSLGALDRLRLRNASRRTRRGTAGAAFPG